MFCYDGTLVSRMFSQGSLLSVRFIRRGRASVRKKDLDDDNPSDFEEIASEVEEDELREWLSSAHIKTKGLIPGETLIRKFLPPGTITDLYEHYKATQELLGGYAVSYFCSILQQ